VLRGFLRDLDVEILDLGIVADDREATRQALRRAAAEADLILTSGGMSVGEEDHVIAAVQAEGQIDVWKIAAKPGKPLAFGAVRHAGGETAFIGLPGNPVAVWSGLLTLAAPYLRVRQGLTRVEPAPLTLRADFAYRNKGNRIEFVRVRRNEQGGLDLFPTQDSAVIPSAVWCDGVAIVPAGANLEPGVELTYLPGPGWQP
jgi:molybdopterin molybdotransferase